MPRSPGYLDRIEANVAGVRAGPDVIWISLTRDFAGEAEKTKMFAEFTLEQARELHQNLGEAIERAEAKGCCGYDVVASAAQPPARLV